MIRFDTENRIQDFTYVLSLRTHDHLGQIRNINPDDVVVKVNMNAANELSLTVYKEDNGYIEPLWDEITDFKYIYVPELNEYFEITVENNDGESLYKTISGISACEAELSQSYVYNLEINTEADIARTDYTTPTIFYDPLKPECSLLNRALYKMPHYSIKHVDASLMNIQRTFSADGTDVYSFLVNDVAEEIGCLFLFDSTDRSISVYDLYTYCVDCGKRGEFSDVCPECGSTNLKYYGEDTTIYVDTENLAESVTLTVDTDSVKNCFKLEAGDDDMTAAIVNLNPNGSDYIYYFSEEQKHDMPAELVAKLESYDALVKSYEEEYEQVMKNMYEAIDKVLYYTSGMMPTQEDDPTNAELEAAKLTEAEMSPMALTDVTSSTSTATVNTALKNYAKVFVKSGYFKIEINEGEFTFEGENEGKGHGYWYGNFKITNYSDEEDVATSPMIRIEINEDFDTFIDQKIKKKLALDSEEDGSIFDVLSIKDLDAFKDALTYYGLNRLTSFHDAVQGCLDIMIEMNQAKENADLYQSMYIPYYDKLAACQTEMDKRQATIDEWYDKLNAAEQRRNAIQKILNFENYLGEDMFKDFCCYKREDKYTNENYISDGFENDEIFERAREFIEAAKVELVKSGERQRQLSATLSNLLCMEEFEPIKEYFKEGNFIRVGIDGQVYRLRLISYQISFGSIQNIDVEFSDVTRMRDGVSDLRSILNQASSMASSYGATVHQVEKSKEKTALVTNWVNSGLDATTVKIVNNADNQNITIGDAGLLARRKDDFYDKYDSTQLKLMSTGIYVTDNAWRSVKSCVGKYYYTDPETGELVEAYGLLADAIVGNIILGSELGIYSSDGSSQMSFDNFGLVLNTIDNGSGQYKRILDIQKTDADGNTTSQLYIDTDGNIVLATDQMIQTVEAIDRLNAQYADIENLYVSNATIRNLLAEYATIENLKATNAEIENLKAEDVTITGKLTAAEASIGELEADNATIHGKLTANEASIKDLTAENATITGKLSAAEAEIADLEATKATIGYVDAYKAEVEQLFADYASIEYLDANYIKTEAIEANYAKITDLNATNATIENLKAKDAEIENLVAEKATIEQLNATNANIDKLTAKDAEIESLVADKVDAEYVDAEILEANKAIVDDLEANYAKITTLESDYAKIEYVDAEIVATEQLIAEKATIQDLNAANANIGTLQANVVEITSVMAGNVGADLIQTIHLTGQNVVIDDAVIKSAMIEALSADKLTAGTIDTGEITLQSEDGSMVIQGSFQQFKDENGVVRIQLGKDAEGNFTFVLYDETGNGVLINSDGIQSSDALADGLIVDAHVDDNAAIQGSKLDIDSVISEINDNGTTTIKATKIWIDEENQSIGAKFDSITEQINDLGETVESKVSQTDFVVEQGKIETLIKETEIIREELDNIEIGEIGGRNLLRKTNPTKYFSDWRVWGVVSTLALEDDDWLVVNRGTSTSSYGAYPAKISKIPAGEYTISFEAYSDAPTALNYLYIMTSADKNVALSKNIAITSEPTKYIEKITISEDYEDCSIMIGTSDTSSLSFYLRHLKLENGDYATAYTEAPEDLEGDLTTLTDRYNQTVSTVEGNVTKIGNVTTTVNTLTGEVESMDSRMTEIETTANGIFAKVSSIGGQNLFYHSSKDWLARATGDDYIFVGCYKESTDNDMEGRNVTLSVEFKTDNTTSGTFDVCYYGGNSVSESDVKTLFSSVKIADLVNSKYVNTFVYPTTTPLPEAADGSEQMYTMVLKVTNVTGALSVRKGMLQYGLIATEWQPTSDNLSESVAQVSVEADKINWLVKSGTDESNFELTSRAATLVAEEINLKGLVTFSGLNSDITDMITSGGSTVDKTIGSGYEFIDRRYESDTDCRPFISGVYEVVPATTLTTGTENESNLIKTVDGVQLYTDYIPWNFNDNPFYCSIDIYYAGTTDGTVYVQVGFFDENKTAIGGNNGYNLNLIGNRSVAAADTWQTFEYSSENKIVSSDTYPRHKTKYIRFRYLPRYNGQTGTSYMRNFTIKQLGANTPTILETDMNRWVSNAIISGTTTINGGYIQTNSITSAQINTNQLFATNAFVGSVQTVELNANMIKSGTIHADLLDLYDLKVTHKTTGAETLSITNNGDITLRGSVESYNYVDGKSGWAIHADGDAEFNDVTVRGSVIGNYGGIASCGGSGTNLQQWSSFFDGTTGNKWVLNSAYTIDTQFLYDGINTVKYSRSGLTESSIAYFYTSRANNLIVPVVGKSYTASAKFYTKDYSAIDGAQPFLGIWFYDADGTSIQSERVNIPFANKEWVSVSVTSICPANAASMAFVVGAYRNGTFWFAQSKLEEGDTATAWSLAPEDGIKEVVHWAGASYEERENAPAIIYNDGSVNFTKGTFGGVFTGDIEIGNISIVDPNNHSGNDAILTIQNGGNGVKRVQLRDTASSSFAQDVIITDNFYNEAITLGQDGHAHLKGTLNVGNDTTFSTLSPTRLTLNGIIVDGATAGTLKMLPTVLNVGSASTKTDMTVYGETILKDNLTVEGDIMIGDKLKVTTTSSGVDIEFIK